MFTAIIYCTTTGCSCNDRNGVIVGNYNTEAEALQAAQDACPFGYSFKVVANA
jgi:hypothetical protein